MVTLKKIEMKINIFKNQKTFLYLQSVLNKVNTKEQAYFNNNKNKKLERKTETKVEILYF